MDDDEDKDEFEVSFSVVLVKDFVMTFSASFFTVNFRQVSSILLCFMFQDKLLILCPLKFLCFLFLYISGLHVCEQVLNAL